MIYLFGGPSNLSIIYKGDSLTEEQKSKAIFVTESIPKPESREGFIPILNLNEETKELFYTYEQIPVQEEEQ